VSPFFYQALLRLLPAERRARDGAAMTLVFDELRESTRRDRGWIALAVLWMKETGGLVRFGWRERFVRRSAAAGSGPSAGRHRWDFSSELKWAWRAVRARGWRAGLAVALLAVALAANAVVFSVTDSLVLARVPFREADRIVEIRRELPDRSRDQFVSAALLAQWRNQTDLFSSVQAYLSKTIFVVGDVAELVRTVDVTPGLIELLGVPPRWGRSIAPGDERDTSLQVVLISEALAQKRFGRPELAVGKRIETTADPLMVVGVMPSTFRFPDGTTGIWRAFDPQGPLAQGFAGVMSIARMPQGLSIETLQSVMTQRSPAIGAAAGRPASYSALPGPFYMSSAGSGTMFYMLLGAALCLLLITCANVASLELASALQRARTFAVHVALGASRIVLGRVALFEGLILLSGAVAGAAGLAWLGIEAMDNYLPDAMRLRTANPIDFDTRSMSWMAGAAAVTWALVSLPTLLFASRTRLLHLLKQEDRGAAASRAGRLVRQALTVAEVALALVLTIGGVLYASSYQSLLALDKGFNSTNLAQIGFTIPVQYYGGHGEMPALAAETMRRMTAVPGVIGTTWATAPPSTGNSPTRGKIEIDDRPASEEPIALAVSSVDASYQTVIGLPVRHGRWLQPDDPETATVVTESFARRFWPGQDPVGHRVRPSPRHPWYDVVGVVGNLRGSSRPLAQSTDRSFVIYALRQLPPPPPPPPPGKPPPRATGGSWRFLNITVRMDSADRAEAVLAAARSVDSRVRVELDFVDVVYADMHADTLLATRVVGGFATLAFLVAMVGVYGVMAFLVAGRTREIGIRMALGATARDISRLVMRSSLLTVGLGAGVGIGAALIAARWTGSQFFGVTPTAPGIYVLVTTVVIATSLLATWRPAQSAARIDPAITLKNN
jgi:predicted permease